MQLILDEHDDERLRAAALRPGRTVRRERTDPDDAGAPVSPVTASTIPGVAGR